MHHFLNTLKSMVYALNNRINIRLKLFSLSHSFLTLPGVNRAFSLSDIAGLAGRFA
jgi:hypothetical protein